MADISSCVGAVGGGVGLEPMEPQTRQSGQTLHAQHHPVRLKDWRPLEETRADPSGLRAKKINIHLEDKAGDVKSCP